MKIDSPLAMPRTRKNSYPSNQIAAQSTGLWEPVTASTARLACRQDRRRWRRVAGLLWRCRFWPMLKKMLGSTAFEHDSLKLPRAGFVTVTKLVWRATKEKGISFKTEWLNARSNASQKNSAHSGTINYFG
jgi:hypothetical protein